MALGGLTLVAAAIAGCGSSADTPATTGSPSSATTAKVAAGGIVDGKHFGYIRAIAEADGTRVITFDEGSMLSGDAATAAARADGVIGPDEPVPNDVYVTNPDTATVALPVDPGVTVTRISCVGGCNENTAGRIDDLAASFGHEDESNLGTPYRGASSQYWVTTTAGVVTRIDEQYLP